MRIALLGICSCIVLCVPIWLTVCDGQGPSPADRDVRTALLPPTEEDAGASALKSELQQISRRLRDLEYPELRKRDPREIQVVQQLVDGREGLFKAVKAMHAAGVRSSSEVAAARYHLAAARAELAWAKQDVHEAVSRLVEAADSAAEMIVLSRADYGAARTTLGAAVEAQALWAKTKLALIRAEKVAAAAKVDISDITRESGGGLKERPSPDRPPVLVPPPAAETLRR